MTALEQGYLLETLLRRIGARYAKELAGMTPRQVHELVIAAIAKAATFRVRQPEDIERFVGLVLMLGPELDSSVGRPWLGELLRHPLLNGSEKLRQIDARLAGGGP